jgi:mannose-6-phosphate isomerase-like protein (cupin superfamily)
MHATIQGARFLAISFIYMGVATAANPSVGAPAGCAWPPSADAVTAAPGNHHVLLENEQVRVLDVVVPPHTREPVHAHCSPSVLYILEASAFIDRDANGKVLVDTRDLKTPLTFPMTMWKDPEAPHAVENLSDKPLHLIRVELTPQTR